jgi:hypothetical protein
MLAQIPDTLPPHPGPQQQMYLSRDTGPAESQRNQTESSGVLMSKVLGGSEPNAGAARYSRDKPSSVSPL